MKDSSAKATLNITAPDWRSVQDIVSSASIPEIPSFDLFISKRKGEDFRVQVGLPEVDHKDEGKVEYIQSKIPAGLHDLYW